MGLHLSFTWIMVIWSMVPSACLTLMAVHLMIWCQNRAARANLFFALSAGGMAALLFCDLWALQSRTPAEYDMALRWFQLPLWVILVSLIGFVRTYMRTGRLWLAWTAGGLRTLTLILSAFLPVCTTNPWMLVCQMSFLFYLAFMVDAAVTLWRRKERVLMRVLSSALVLLTLYLLSQALLMVCGSSSALKIYCLFFLGILGVMAWDLSWGSIRAAQLSDILRNNEQRFSSIYNSVEDAIFHLKVEAEGQYRFISVNRSFCRVTGLRQDQVIGKTVNEVIPEPSLTLVLAKYRKAIDEKISVRWEETTDYPAGRLTGEVSIAPVFDHDRCTHLLGSVHDITERKLAEEALKKFIHDDQAALRVARMGHWEFDMATAQFVFNDQYYSLHGMTAEQAGGYRMSAETFASRYVHPEDAHLVAEHIRQAIETNDPNFQVRLEARLLRADGEPWFVTVWFRVEKDSLGRTTKMLGVNQDITERKQTEEALRESEETLRSIFASSPDSIMVSGLDEKIKLCNQSAATMRGFSSPDELIGMSLSKFVAKEDHPRFEELRHNLMIHGLIKDFPFTGLTRSGGRFSGELSVSILKDSSGRPVGFVGITRDVTARKESEQKLEQQRSELVHLSRISTLSELSSSLAHELNQPLLGIRSNAQAAKRFMARKNPDLKEIGNILDDIITDNKRAANVIVKLRELYKKAPYDFTPIDMNHVIGEVLSMVRSYVIIKDVSVTSALDSTIPVMTGDKIQLQQVILNLVLNSFDAMESRPGGRMLRIRTAQEDGAQIVTSVEDNGVGIDAQSRARLFTPFFTTKVKGMGMGLVISKTIVESHGGTIWADDHPGPGAAFHFRLPISKGGAQ